MRGGFGKASVCSGGDYQGCPPQGLADVRPALGFRQSLRLDANSTQPWVLVGTRAPTGSFRKRREGGWAMEPWSGYRRGPDRQCPHPLVSLSCLSFPPWPAAAPSLQERCEGKESTYSRPVQSEAGCHLWGFQAPVKMTSPLTFLGVRAGRTDRKPWAGSRGPWLWEGQTGRRAEWAGWGYCFLRYTMPPSQPELHPNWAEEGAGPMPLPLQPLHFPPPLTWLSPIYPPFLHP